MEEMSKKPDLLIDLSSVRFESGGESGDTTEHGVVAQRDHDTLGRTYAMNECRRLLLC